jgi:Phage tail assembly chaperone protein
MKTFYLIHFPTRTAQQFFGEGLPSTWNNVTGMSELTDEVVSDMTWSGNPEFGFLSETMALNIGVTQESITKVHEVASVLKKPSVIEKRNELLTQADKLTQADRWDKYTQAQKDEVALYKQTLKDIPQTTTDWFRVVWPTAPRWQ